MAYSEAPLHRRPHQTRWFMVISCGLFGVCASISIVGWAIVGRPETRSVMPNAGSIEVSREAGIVIRFSKPVNRRVLAPSITPVVQGEWLYEAPLFSNRLFRGIRFLPAHPLDPETVYTVTLDGVVDALAIGTPRSISWSFTTSPLPGVAAVSPAEGEKDISPDKTITLTLSAPSDESVIFTATLEPNVPLVQSLSEDRSIYSFRPTLPLQQGTRYVLRIDRAFLVREYVGGAILRQSEPETMSTTSFDVRLPPRLSAVEPSGEHVSTDHPIRITFNEPMNRASVESGFLTEPSTEGFWSWDASGAVAEYRSKKALLSDTAYSVVIPQGTKTENGGFFESDSSFSFRTIGPVRISGTVPQNNASGIDVTSAIHVRFDQSVAHESAEARVSFEPNVEGAFSWEGSTLSFQPVRPFDHQTTYRVSIGEGIEGVGGLPSADALTVVFTTAPETVMLNVAIDLQDRPLSCEAAALKMALARYGIRASEDSIMEKVGFDPTPHNGGVWGDPYEAFVGDINGKQNTTGYGVYWGPIAAAANSWRPSEARTGMTVAEVAREIADGHPVIVWGIYGNGYRDDWKTQTGKTVLAWKGEHARTVIGFVGSADAPSKIILNDPYAGRVYWTVGRFVQNWSTFGNAAVIVR